MYERSYYRPPALAPTKKSATEFDDSMKAFDF